MNEFSSKDIKPSVLFIGGDARVPHAAEYFIKKGHTVTLYGFDLLDKYPSGVRISASLERALEGADIAVLPLPLSRDGASIHSPYAKKLTALSYLSEILPKNIKVFGGKISDCAVDMLKKDGGFVFDYYKDETFQLENAHISAEGALMYAMEVCDKSLIDSNIAIVGYGRIAARLAQLLRPFGANVTVFARRSEVRTAARLDGFGAEDASFEGLSSLADGYDIIFNTVPVNIIPDKTVLDLASDTVYIELASPPFGIDEDAAKRSRGRFIWASSIPAKYAPISAGEILARCVWAHLEGEVTS